MRAKLVALLLVLSVSLAALTVRDVRFLGAEQFSAAELRGIIATQPGDAFDYPRAKEDMNRVLRWYVEQGYFNVDVLEPSVLTNADGTVDVVFTIREYGSIAIVAMQFSGNRYLSSDYLRSALPVSLSLSQMPLYLESLLSRYTDNGFLFAEVTLDSLRLMRDGCSVSIGIDEGRECRFTEYRFRGNAATREQTLLKLSRLQDATVITSQILQQAAARIARKAYIQSCTLLPLDAQTLLFDIQEGRMSSIAAVLGLNSASDNAFTGYVDLEFLNLFGSDRSLSFHWQQLTADRSSVQLQYHEAGPDHYPVSGDGALYREEVDSTYIKATLDAEIYYYTLANEFGLATSWEQYSPAGRSDALKIFRSAYRTIGGFWRHLGADDLLNPTRGTESKLHYYTRISDVAGNETNRQAVEADLQHYWPVAPRQVLSAGIHAKVMENKALTSFDLFSLGGTSDLRGFGEDQFSGYRLGWLNLEWRYLLSRSSRGFLFIDWAAVHSDAYTWYDLLGCGFGLRLQTRLGLLGLDYGIGYNNGDVRNPLDGILHVGIKTNL
jgi:outer membrane protein assembly factor BamA